MVSRRSIRELNRSRQVTRFENPPPRDAHRSSRILSNPKSSDVRAFRNLIGRAYVRATRPARGDLRCRTARRFLYVARTSSRGSRIFERIVTARMSFGGQKFAMFGADAPTVVRWWFRGAGRDSVSSSYTGGAAEA